MQKGNLKCDATNCAHNIDYKCKAGAIHVSGLGAVAIEGTSCTSFVDRDSSSFVNSSGDLTTNSCDIKCEAHNCMYNKNKKCYADNVEIDADNAYCNSFDYREHA
ncbi:MAG: DUF1540 domain-containing protein [Paeniclostridium sordellii]|nr:DUF1540 domain-containing protein [Paeniclostridium sordellii]